MLCHFYYQPKNEKKEKQKKYYTKVDYAHFNLFNKSNYWMIKGTTGHGIDTTSEVPVFNCYKVNSEFIKALKKPVDRWKADYELGLIMDKEKLAQGCETYLRDVTISYFGDSKNESMPSWCLDRGRNRKGRLDPFNMCDVVRLRILRNRYLGVSMKTLNSDIVKAVLTKRGDGQSIRKLLDDKEWNDCKVFPLLPCC